MFGVRKARAKAAKVETVIGRGTHIVGNVTFHGGLHVDGTIEGNVAGAGDAANAVLIVSEAGTIVGDVQVANVVLNGAVTGNVRASERIELAERARVSGNVYYRLLEMEMGAEVNGNLVRETGEPAMLSYDGASAQTLDGQGS